MLSEEHLEILRQKAQPVEKVTPEIVDIMHDMLEVMYKSKGIGLAANQVGLLHRIIVLDLSEERNGQKALFMANPEIIWQDENETFTYEEGCLSVPGQRAKVTRPKSIVVRYINHLNEKQEIKAEDLFSQCLQHEIDHLDGVLFVDHLSKLKADMLLKKLDKQKQNYDND